VNAAVGTPERILVVALDNVGDVVFTSALTPSLHHAFPDARIDVWSRAYTAAIAGLIPHVTTVIAADPFWAVPPNESRPPMLPFLRSVRAVARNRYDVAIVTEAPWRVAAAVAATGIPIRIGPRRRRNTHLLTHVLPAENPRKPVLQEQARLLSALGVRVDRPRYRLDESRLAGPRADVANRLGARFAAFHPFARERGRCVALTEWTQLAFALHARGCPVLWVGTTQELNEIRRLHTHPHGFYVDQLPDASLRATAAALSLATLFVGHDSGPLHIAGAFGVPVVGVFAPGQPDRTFPQGVGPWRIIARPSPEGITAGSILREIDALDLASTP
jgi:ADP-heptose:LPS heptosyltransferase